MRFRVDVTEALGDGGTIAVKVDNSARPDVAPLIGDFPIFGGLYRGVSLIARNATHLDLLDAGGGSGVIVRQQQLTATSATVRVTSSVVSPEGAQVLTRIADRSGKVVAQATAAAGANVSQTLEVPNPHRWNGTADPYLYSVRVAVVVDGQVVDAVRAAARAANDHGRPRPGPAAQRAPLPGSRRQSPPGLAEPRLGDLRGADPTGLRADARDGRQRASDGALPAGRARLRPRRPVRAPRLHRGAVCRRRLASPRVERQPRADGQPRVPGARDGPWARQSPLDRLVGDRQRAGRQTATCTPTSRRSRTRSRRRTRRG